MAWFSFWFSFRPCLHIPCLGRLWATVIAVFTLMRTPLAASNRRSSRNLVPPSLREQGLTVGELVLIVLVILVAAGGAWLFLGSQQPTTPSSEPTVESRQPY